MYVGTSRNSIECARVYVNYNEQIEFLVKCLFCLRNFKQWARYASHFHLNHDQRRIYQPEKKVGHEAANGSSAPSEVAQIDTGKLYKTTPESTEIILLTGGLVSEAESINEYIEPIENLEKENCHEIEYLDSEWAQYISGKNKIDNSMGIEKEHTNSEESLVDLAREPIVDLKVEILHRRFKENKGLSGEIMDGDNVKVNTEAYLDVRDNAESSDYRVLESLQTNFTTRCFFQLRRTDPSIILGFIDIIQQHPCQWNSQDLDFEHKDKRDESAKQICKELKNVFNITISPQIARSSVLYLLRWFEREYLRSLKCGKTKTKTGRWSRNGYVCAHPEYYARLLEFVPHKHLQLVFCDKCQRQFKTQMQLLVHAHQVHGGEVPFSCRYCRRPFMHASTLRHHENRHTMSHAWKCSLCGHSSATKTDHNLHKVTHTDLRAYACDLCGASYKSSTSLNVHLRTHEPPRLKCSTCGKKFYENYRLKRHLLIHEAEASVKAEVARAKFKE